MFYRTCPNLTAPTEADVDTPEMVETAAAVGRNERDVRMLERLAELAMELAEVIAQNAKTCLEATPNPSFNPTAAFNRMAQTVRRTLALKSKLGETVEVARADLAGRRERRRAKLDKAHGEAMEIAIGLTFCHVLAERFPDLEGEAEGLLRDMEDLLSDSDEFKDCLDRPVGETVAKLCAAMGLDPALCVLDGETWKAPRPPYTFEAAKMAQANPPVPPCTPANFAAAATGPPG